MGQAGLLEARQRSWPEAMDRLLHGYHEVIVGNRPLYLYYLQGMQSDTSRPVQLLQPDRVKSHGLQRTASDSGCSAR
jgi:hypothetical protein